MNDKETINVWTWVPNAMLEWQRTEPNLTITMNLFQINFETPNQRSPSDKNQGTRPIFTRQKRDSRI